VTFRLPFGLRILVTRSRWHLRVAILVGGHVDRFDVVAAGLSSPADLRKQIDAELDTIATKLAAAGDTVVVTRKRGAS
jgi:hypothetical protein